MPTTVDPKVLTDAKTAGAQIANDAKTFAHNVLAHAAGDLEADLPDIESAGATAFFDLLPASARGTVQSFAGSIINGELAIANPAITADIQKWAGYALTRIDAFKV